MTYLIRAMKFTCRNVFRNTKYFFSYFFSFFKQNQVLNPKFLSKEELLKEIKEGKSLIRIGDGEIYIMNFGSIHYQKFDPKLREFFLKMIKEYNENSPYLIGIPETYLGMTNNKLKEIGLFHCWLPFKVIFENQFNKQAKYFDAHLFYRTNSFQLTLEGILSSKKILLITSEENWEQIREELTKKLSVEFIPCKASNAFDEIDILLSILHQKIGANKDEYRVLISAGPASKAIIYELSKEGIVGYDLGRGIEAIYRPGALEASI